MMCALATLGVTGCGPDAPGRSPATSGSTSMTSDSPRPDASMFSLATEGLTEGFEWQAMKAETAGGVCLQIIGAMVDGAEPLADYRSELDPGSASCVRDARLKDERNAYINPTTAYPLPNRVDGVWGVVAPEVTLLEFVVPAGVMRVVPEDGVFFVALDTAARKYSLRVHRGSGPVLECDPVGALQDLTVYCG